LALAQPLPPLVSLKVLGDTGLHEIINIFRSSPDRLPSLAAV
jgi:hypothetical protein